MASVVKRSGGTVGAKRTDPASLETGTAVHSPEDRRRLNMPEPVVAIREMNRLKVC